MHALIIEDQPIIALIVEEHLRDAGYASFDIVATETDAVNAARTRYPDLITSDVRLAEGSGIAAVRAICSEGRIPVVFITASVWEYSEQLSGAVVLAKPFGPAEFDHALTRAGAVRTQEDPVVPPSSLSSL